MYVRGMVRGIGRTTRYLHSWMNGTEVEMTFEATPLTLPAKMMSVLMRPMIKSVAKHCMQDLEDLKASIES